MQSEGQLASGLVKLMEQADTAYQAAINESYVAMVCALRVCLRVCARWPWGRIQKPQDFVVFPPSRPSAPGVRARRVSLAPFPHVSPVSGAFAPKSAL